MIAKGPFTLEERERIRAAVAAAQARSSAIFALAIVPMSDRYRLFPLLWGTILAIAGVGVLAFLQPLLPIRTAFIVQAAMLIVLTVAFDWPPLRLRLVPKAVKQHHARQMAHREFAARILATAEHRNGILFFVSLGERYVEVIADRDIHKLVAEGTWERVVADFVAAAKAGRVADGFIAAVEACSNVLETHHPAASGDATTPAKAP